MNKEEWMSLLLMMFNFFFVFFQKPSHNGQETGCTVQPVVFCPAIAWERIKYHTHINRGSTCWLQHQHPDGCGWCLFFFRGGPSFL